MKNKDPLLQNIKVKIDRHDKAIEKYKNYERCQSNKTLISDMIQGNNDKQMRVPKVGEYMVVASDKKEVQNLDIALTDLLDGSKSFSELKQRALSGKLDIPESKKRLQSAMIGANKINVQKRLPSAIGLTYQKKFTSIQEMEKSFEIYDEDAAPYVQNQEDQNNEIKAHPQSKITITKNLKYIMRKQDVRMMTPSVKVLNDLADEEYKQKLTEKNSKLSLISKNSSSKASFPKLPSLASSSTMKNLQSDSSLCRPVSSKYLLKVLHDESKSQQSQNILKNAQNYDQSYDLQNLGGKNSYQVQSIKKGPKYIKGHQIVDQQQFKEYFENKPQNVSKLLQSPFMNGDLQAEIKIQERLNLPKPKVLEGPYEASSGFLPLDYYLVQDEEDFDLQSLIEKYTCQESKKCMGESKWFDKDANFVWKKCEIKVYDNEKNRFLIQWCDKNTTKLVTRPNLRFDLEDKDKFDDKIREGEQFRNMSEIYLKYNFMIDELQLITTPIKQSIIDRILILALNYSYKLPEGIRNPIEFNQIKGIKKFNCKRFLVQKPLIVNQNDYSDKFQSKQFDLELMNQLQQEFQNDYDRTNRKIYFDRLLPFSSEHQILFKQYLDESMFVPKNLIPRKETNQLGMIDIGYSEESQFLLLFKKMTNIMHQADMGRLKTLQDFNNSMLELEQDNLFQSIFKKPLDLIEFQQIQEQCIHDCTREFESKKYDVNFKLMDMVDHEIAAMKARNAERALKIIIESERKAAEETEIPADIVINLQRFQNLINTKLEKSARELYKNSIMAYIDILKKIIDKFIQYSGCSQINKESLQYEQILTYQNSISQEKWSNKIPMLNINLTIEQGNLIFEPSLNEWRSMLLSIKDHAFTRLTSYECLKTKDIGPVRESLQMNIFNDQDYLIDEKNQELSQKIDSLLLIPEIFLEKVQLFNRLIKMTTESAKKQFRKYQFQELQQEIYNFKQIQNTIDEIFNSNQLKTGLFLIKCESSCQTIRSQLQEIQKTYIDVVQQKISKESQQVGLEVEEIIKKLKIMPTNIEQLYELRQHCENEIPQIIQNQIQNSESIMKKIQLLEQLQYQMPADDVFQSWQCYGLPGKIDRKTDKCLKNLKDLEAVFAKGLIKQQANLAKDFENLKYQFDVLKLNFDITKYEKCSREFDELGSKLDDAIKESEIINNREQILKINPTEYGAIEKLKKEYMPYNRVWNLARFFYYSMSNIMNGPMNQIDRNQLTTDIQDSWTELFKYEKTTFKTIMHMAELSKQVKMLYENFKPYLPLINDLRNPSIRKRHQWQQLAETIGFDVDQDSELNMSFQQLLDNNILDKKEQVRNIAEISQKEDTFEKIINKMKYEWKQMSFQLTLYRDSGCNILKGLDPILDKLDEDISRISSIASSPYVKFIYNEVQSWKQQLQRSQEVIELWLKVQKSWQYLQPIFFSDDIIKQMPKEGGKYQVIDKIWRMFMNQTDKNPSVLEACNQPKAKENFMLSIKTLDEVIKGLNDYLNLKRMAFPRFFFLSNDELLSILAQTREVTSVQRHLPKCFEGIYKITFEGPQLIITEMISSDLEVIKFVKQIKPMDTENNVRGVEEWLSEVEKSMKESIKQNLFDSIKDYTDQTREQWLFNWPAQSVVTIDMVLWTIDVQKSLIELAKNQWIDVNPLQLCYDQYNQKLLKIVEMVRGEMPRIHRMTLGVMVVTEVHAKDVIENMLQQQVSDIDDFEWLSQMRYYLENNQCIVKMINTEKRYGYEYLGNQARLVITPLTDRCYRTLMSALHMNLGGGPEGPAGTGKTETTKDLAKSLAKHCVVLNCSDQFDYQMMGKFFKGLCSCGSWACFDEFNRIEIEVLSVIAQQILTIQTAIFKESESKVKPKEGQFRIFTFEGSQIPLDSSCAIFITMNPGYAGRAELPDNLKALFRPIAMMVPNFAMITEISLYSYGYFDSRNLSVKVVTSLKLASEQLSTQSHYDFGMRTVKTIITAAGNLKRENIKENESILIQRAICDSNIPKFTSEDVPLFEAIISDLFPSIEMPKSDYGLLQNAIEKIIIENNLINSEIFNKKIVELFETINVRHGLMVVGNTLSGKSTIIEVLSQALFLRNKMSLAENSTDVPQKVNIQSLNPKSITPSFMYGENDLASNEWKDGITATIFRECFEDLSEQLQWIVFDGPVDALWIENLNTVLDDNKKLTLANGESIKLTKFMSLIFEVEDLLEASPATVSRCGMVFMEQKNLPWKALFNPWFESLVPSCKTNDHKEYFQALLENLAEPMIQFMSQDQIKLSFTTISVQQLFINCMKLFESLLYNQKTKQQILNALEEESEREAILLQNLKLEGKEMSQEKIDEMRSKKIKLLPIHMKCNTALFTYSLAWSLGCVLQENYKILFSDKLKQLYQQLSEKSEFFKDIQNIPEDKSIWEIYFDIEKMAFCSWIKQEARFNQEIPFHELYIPTFQNQSHGYWVNQLLSHDFPILIQGKTGTGKTSIIKRFLLFDAPGRIKPTFTAFSANTSAGMVQEVTEQKLEKQKRRKGVYGPLVGTTNIIFVDDYNMPNKEKYGAQPPLELIRQWFVSKGLYDLKTQEFKQIQDIQFAAAMGTSRPSISQRVTRHFNIAYMDELDYQTQQLMVQSTLKWGFETHSEKIKSLIGSISNISIEVYQQVCKKFLPLPKKSHYLFNFRDLMRVLQGIISVPANKYNSMEDNRQKLLNLWVHECLRVYSDRLVDKSDKLIFSSLLEDVIKNQYNIEMNEICKPDQTLMYGNFMDAHALNKVYCQINNTESLSLQIHEYINEWNVLSKLKIDVVLFTEALELLSKINRIISSPFGHLLLIGFGGSGRHTMTRLASHMQDYGIFELDIEKDFSFNEWYDFWRETLKKVAFDDKHSVFLMSDSQIVDERFLEDINNLLNIGEIPNLYVNDEKEAIIEDIKDIAQKAGIQNLSPLNLWEYFVNQCKQKLHIALTLSPIGEKIRIRFRNFPSLISCASPLWIMPWGQEALYTVAQNLLSQNKNKNNNQQDYQDQQDQQDQQEVQDENEINNDLQKNMDEQNQKIQSIAKICVSFHSSVDNVSQEYFKQTGKYFYVTPIGYKKLLQNFSKSYDQKLQELQKNLIRYKDGVAKLDECNIIVNSMEANLKELQPVLLIKTEESDKTLKKVQIETEAALIQKVQVQKDEVETAIKAQTASKIQAECTEELSKAEPELLAAIAALKTLKITDFVEMKSFQKPPILIRLTMDAVCIMMARQPKKNPDKTDDYWDEAKKLLSEPQKFIKMLENYKREEIPLKVIEKMTQFTSAHPEFIPKNVLKTSVAAEGLCKWCLAIFKFHFVFQSIIPLKNDLQKANADLKEAEDELKKKQILLQEVQDKCDQLKEIFEQQNFEKEKLKAQIKDCEVKMERAVALTGGLAGERVQWSLDSQQLEIQISKLMGDMLLAVGSISYLGAFSGIFRQKILNDFWIPKVLSENINCTSPFSLIKRLGNEIEIQKQQQNGLPLDEVSIENAIIMNLTDQVPLIIDPQNQASKYLIKMNTQEDSNLILCKPGKDLSWYLEQAVRMGQTVIIQKIGETIDPVLDPILTNQIDVKGNQRTIQIGNSTVEYNSNFKLYLITSLPNPHYSPENLTKITLLNFTVTSEGLKDQMLSIIAQMESPADEDEKNRIIIENSQNFIKKKDIESNILQLLQNTEGSKMLDDENLIQTLKESKATSNEIEERMAASKITEDRINTSRSNYENVAKLASLLYFTIFQLTKLDPMYDFSLEFFIKTFRKSIKNAEKPQEKNKIKLRVQFVAESLKRHVFYEISRSIFVKHKLLFAFLITLANQQIFDQYDQDELSFLLTGVSSQPIDENIQSPDIQYISEKNWRSIQHLSNLQQFKVITHYKYITDDNYSIGLDQKVSLSPIIWNDYFEKIEDAEPPTSDFQIKGMSYLTLVKSMRPDLFIEKLKEYVQEILGQYFIQNHIISIQDSYNDSDSSTPLLFVLMPGDDPTAELLKFTGSKGKQITPISLGKGQGGYATELIKDSANNGSWVLLQNCHLAISWLNDLVQLVSNIQDQFAKKEINLDFRLWLTAMSTDQFPSFLLQESIKMTKDPPKGIKANLEQIYQNQASSKQEIAFFEGVPEKQKEWQKLYMGLSFFHAILRERKRFGPVGWNKAYDFNESDFKISVRQLQNMLNNYLDIPYKALVYLTAECYYGGRVTDDWDRRVLNCLLLDFYNTDILDGKYQFSPIEEFYVPENMDLENALAFIKELPYTDNPAVFGLHQNAGLSSAAYETAMIIDSILMVNTQSSKVDDKNSALKHQIESYINILPVQFDLKKVQQKYPIQYHECMNTVLQQELLRYNNLIKIITNSLKELLSALGGKNLNEFVGFSSMTPQLEQIMEYLLINKIPAMWSAKSYPSLKPLNSYIKDLIVRVQMFQNWIDNGVPDEFWISGFYFTQSFLSGVLQNYARKTKIPIDLLIFDFQVMDSNTIQYPAPDGAYINGLFLEGARWDIYEHGLQESKPNIIYDKMPTIWLIPKEQQDIKPHNPNQSYICPMYKTTERKSFATSGFALNFIISVKLNTNKSEKHWIKRGVALLTQLDD